MWDPRFCRTAAIFESHRFMGRYQVRRGWARALLALGTVAIGTLGMAACTSRGQAAPDRPSLGDARDEIPGMVGRRCHYTSETAPPFEQLARVGTRGNIALWGWQLTAGDTVDISIRYGDDGRLVWAEAIRSTVAPDRVAALESLLLRTLEEEGPADWGVRLRVLGGDVVSTRPSVVCPAQPHNTNYTAVPAPATAREYYALNQARGRYFPVIISLDERGRILDVRLPQPSGIDVVDQMLIDWVFATDFIPKLHDGVPVATTLEERLYLPRRR